MTQIEEVTKSRSKVYIDQEFAFVLYKGELRIHHIRVGEELSPEAFRTIKEELLPRRAKLRCMNLLKSRDYTAEQLRGKLRRGFYTEDIIDIAVEYVASYHYIDDLRYAVSYISCYQEKKSRRRLEQDLQGKGVGRETIEKAFFEWEEQGGGQDEQEMLRKLLEKKHFDAANADLKERQRVYAYLMRRGYSGEAVRRAMRLPD